MRVRRCAAIVALPVAAVMLIAGCSSGGSGSGSGGSGGSGNTAGAITIDGTQPENPLVPSNTNEVGGGNVVDALFSRLVKYNVDTAKPEMNVADSIDTSDAKNFDIKLKSGWTFHDGTPVDAASFVDAWNWAAYAPNGALNSSFFEHIQGYDALNPKDPDGKTGPQKAPKPTTDKMTGLTVVSPTEFKVVLTAPYSPFEPSLGYAAFSPMPKSFFADPTAFGRKPVGNGPFKFVEWNDNADIKITRFDAYQGVKPKVKDVTFKLYQSQDAAYADLTSGNLDFQQKLPTADIAGDKYKTDLNSRSIAKDVLVTTAVDFPLYDPKFQNPDLRKAISMAINRDQITKVIFSGTETPSTSYSSPGVAGYQPGTCGDLCKYDPAKAKALLQKAGGFTGKLTLSYNADGDNKGWTEATCNSIKDALGIDCVANPVPTFADFRKQINASSMTGMFRAAWQYDYPNLENALAPLYRTGGSANDSHYSNPAFDAALDKAAAQPNQDAANAGQISGYSEAVGNVKVNAFGVLDLTDITVTK